MHIAKNHLSLAALYIKRQKLQPPIRKKWDSMEKPNKKESSDFKIYFDLYFKADNMNTKYLIFCLVKFILM